MHRSAVAHGGVRLAVLPALLAGLLGSLPPARAQSFEGVPGLDDPRPARPPARALAPSQRLGLHPAAVPEVRLDALDLAALLAEDARTAASPPPKSLRIGVGRPVALGEGDGEWLAVPGGRVWLVDLTSPGAKGVRLHLEGRLPAGSELALYAAPEPRGVVLYRAGQLRGGTWSPTIFGERVRIEYFSPGAPAGLPFAIDELQHHYRDLLAADLRLPGEDAAGPCHNDVTCYPEWADVARASARIDIIRAHNSYSCSGQLLNDVAQDHTPLFLTAYHCVHNQNVAAGLEFFWLYQTAACDGAPPALDSVPRSQGATLLAAGPASDYSLLMVEGTLPTGLYWDGWNPNHIAAGTLAACVHHPSGDFTRISFGSKNGYAGCGSSNFVHVDWYSGPTEPGSSGSGVFTQSSHQLFGALTDGPSSCDAVTWDCFGAFATTYRKIRGFLNRGSDDSSEPNDSCAAARTTRPGTLRNRIVRWNDPDWYRTTVPAGATLTVSIAFASANGELGLDLLPACGAAPIQSSADGVDSARVQVTNTSGAPVVYAWHVYLVDDVRNGYDLTVRIN